MMGAVEVYLEYIHTFFIISFLTGCSNSYRTSRVDLFSVVSSLSSDCSLKGTDS